MNTKPKSQQQNKLIQIFPDFEKLIKKLNEQVSSFYSFETGQTQKFLQSIYSKVDELEQNASKSLLELQNEQQKTNQLDQIIQQLKKENLELNASIKLLKKGQQNLTVQNQNQEQQLKQKDTQLGELNQQMMNTKKQLKQIQQEKNNLEVNIEQITKEKTILTNQLQNEKANSSTQVNNIIKEKNDMQTKNNSIITQLEQVRIEKQELSQNSESQKVLLTNEIEQLKNDKNQLSNQLQLCNKEKSDLIEYNKKATEYANQINQLQDEKKKLLNEASNEKNTYQNQIKSLSNEKNNLTSQLQQKNTEIEGLFTSSNQKESEFSLQINQLKNEKDNLNTQISTINDKNNDLTKIINQQNVDIQNQTQKMEDLESQINQIKSDNNKMTNQINQLTNENNQLNIEKTQINSQLEESKQEKEQQNNKLIEMKNQQSDLTKKMDQEKALIEKLQSELESNNTEEKKQQIFDQNFKNQFSSHGSQPYDIQILFGSLLELQKGIDVVINNKSKELIDQIVKTKVIQVGYLGNFNTGKTFLLSQLMKPDDANTEFLYKQGLDEKTIGFNLVIDKNFKIEGKTKILHIDTAGAGEALGLYKKVYELQQLENSEQNELYINQILMEIESTKQQKYEDYIASEKFIQNYIFEQCQVVVVMVGIMTKDDEMLINFVCKKKKEDPNKKVIIVHNLYNCSDQQGMDKQIVKDILKCYKVERKEVDNIVVYQDFSWAGKSQPVTHVYIGRQNSSFSKNVNLNTIKYIRSQIDGAEIDTIKVNFFLNMQQYINQSINNYLIYETQNKSKDGRLEFVFKQNDNKQQEKLCQCNDIEIQQQKQSEVKDQEESKVEIKENIHKEIYGQFVCDSIQQGQNYLKLQEIYFDFFGQIIKGNYGTEIYPNYVMYEKKYSDDNNSKLLHLFIELQGCNVDLKNKEKNEIKIKFTKNETKSKHILIIESERKHPFIQQQQQNLQTKDQNSDELVKINTPTYYELKYGKVSQTIVLCDLKYDIDKKKIKYNYINGIIEITIPIYIDEEDNMFQVDKQE